LIICSGIEAKKNLFNPLFRDNLSQHWIALRNHFLKCGINLITEYDSNLNNHDFEIHIDIQEKRSNVPAFLILWESKFIYPINLNKKKLAKYHRLFSWDTQTDEFKNAVKYFFPYLWEPVASVDGYSKRTHLVVMIASNKSLPNFKNPYNLYIERVKIIRWFEKYFPEDFALYGSGWDKSAKMPTKLGSLIHLIESMLPWKPFRFTSWQGIIEKKNFILEHSRFSIVYENLSGQYDYITEKIFDAFKYGNVPVYWGAKNISDFIPKNSFIDRREFCSHYDLYRFLKDMKEDEYLKYQNNIKNFLKSDSAKIFSINNFIKIITSQIISDLKESFLFNNKK
jgi:hypothetical protein